MQNKKNQTAGVGQMIQRCHKWRQKRKQYIDQARQTTDEIERERLLQAAEHYGRIVNAEQEKIDSSRGGAGEKLPDTPVENTENNDEEEIPLPEFIENLK
jgi:F0F1-type ATP synthase membrane subunit b/b'